MFLLKPRFVIPLALVVGMIATYGVYRYLKAQELALVVPATETRDVLVASIGLDAGTVLEDTHLQVQKWPEEIVPAESYATVDSVLGRVLRTDLASGEAILRSKLAPTGSSGGISGMIPTGMRAFTVAVNVVSGVGGFILPRTRVDVLATVKPEGPSKENTTRTILQNVEVLAVDQTYQKDSDEPVTVKSVTLLVTPADSEKLALAANEGKLQLALRSSVDTEVYNTSGIRVSQLVSHPKPKRSAPRKVTKKTTKPAPPPPPEPRVVEVFRANVKSEVTFDPNQEAEATHEKR